MEGRGEARLVVGEYIRPLMSDCVSGARKQIPMLRIPARLDTWYLISGKQNRGQRRERVRNWAFFEMIDLWEFVQRNGLHASADNSEADLAGPVAGLLYTSTHGKLQSSTIRSLACKVSEF